MHHGGHYSSHARFVCGLVSAIRHTLLIILCTAIECLVSTCAADSSNITEDYNAPEDISYLVVPDDKGQQIYRIPFNPPIDRRDLDACVQRAPTICLKRLQESILDSPDDIDALCQVRCMFALNAVC